ncbi:Sir2 family NAD-dependent protein deacetylase [Parasphaerochaeta coccoides]|uniref:protein acetyllysine N-acetyltransferase n=1 Tax=Parasphaerochaeta coccoides (strain ATCC BAA-1237 / DSM 17374 / SPN1) TaxID=760011 RepID=F4GJ74_PARC1|nr:Sir2 family NAD-dependent protein deacetylase [Parasphaerochaeta coccoides]AEC01714.1 NAD-dependent deacetylase [Parasphaerochaeta coccoides DSM 17374]
MAYSSDIQKLEELIASSHRMVIFTGAGVSTMSGIPDFRGTHGAYSDAWHGMDVEDILSIDFFKRSPEIFYAWARDVWYRLDEYEPTIVHRVVAELEAKGYIKDVWTQNIDMLHQKAGSRVVHEIHGSPARHHCIQCNAFRSYDEVVPEVLAGKVPLCKRCGGVVKPDIIFYGENLDAQQLMMAREEFFHVDLCVVMGSSLVVQPAASFPLLSCRGGGKLVIVNAQPTPLDAYAFLRFPDLEAVCADIQAWLWK